MATTAVSLANSGLLTVEAASKYLGIRPVTMYEWIRMRKIEHIKMGRLVKFRQSVLDSYLIEKEADEKQAEKKRKRTSGEDWINQLAKHRASSLKGCKKWQNNNPDKMREYRILKVSRMKQGALRGSTVCVTAKSSPVQSARKSKWIRRIRTAKERRCVSTITM